MMFLDEDGEVGEECVARERGWEGNVLRKSKIRGGRRKQR